MHPFDYRNLPRCTFDLPLEFTPAEAASLINPINILIKGQFLLGMTSGADVTFNSLFDIAEEVAATDSCAYIAGGERDNEFDVVVSRGVPLGPAVNNSSFFAPAFLARRFGKAVVLDAQASPQFLPILESWQATSLVAYPLRKNREFVGALVFGAKASHTFAAAQVKLLWILAMQAENALAHDETVRTLSFYAFLDPLTHLHNRRFFDEQLEKEIFRSRRSGKPFSLLMVDIDGFKNYNDRFLHSAGDVALQELATIMRDTVREVDTVARFGGDEFAIVLIESGVEGARDLAERLGARLRKHLLPGTGTARTETLTVSIGIASFPSDSFERQDIVRKADRALYAAKKQGGGRVCAFHEVGALLTVEQTAGDIPIQKIYNAARSVVDMDKFLEILLFTAMQGLSAGRGSIVVTDPKGEFTLRAAVGFSNGEERLGPGSSVRPGAVTSWVVEHKAPLVVSGPHDMPPPKQMKKNGYRMDSFLSIPLEHEGHLLGALHLTNRMNKQPFTRDDLASFEPIAAEISRVLHQGISFRENVKTFVTSMLFSLAAALELRYPFLKGHGGRVRDLSLRVGRRLGLSDEDLVALDTASALHDIGLVGVPGSILFKKRKLAELELEIARRHPFIGSKLLEGIPGLEAMRRIILEHQEYVDGSGYPQGLRGEDISLGARILSVVEFFDSITSGRPHRGGLSSAEAAQMIRNSSGVLFDENVCKAFLGEITA